MKRSLGIFLVHVFATWLGFSDAMQMMSTQNPQPSSQLLVSRGSSSRRMFLSTLTTSLLAFGFHPQEAEAKSYSSNARNLERMNTGDMSGGSLYDNNPKSDAGKRRRAMTGCKSSTAREELAESVLKIESLSEKDCNQMVMEGNSESMLQALRNLDCPSCPYGISGTRSRS